MSDLNTPERDASGRFVKPPEPEAPRVPGQIDGMHPMARLLFGWVEHKRTPALLLLGVMAVSAALILIDLAYQRHEHFDLANATGFYGLWGFGAFAFAVLSGWPLGRLLRRDEDYYGEGDTRPKDVEAGE